MNFHLSTSVFATQKIWPKFKISVKKLLRDFVRFFYKLCCGMVLCKMMALKYNSIKRLCWTKTVSNLDIIRGIDPVATSVYTRTQKIILDLYGVCNLLVTLSKNLVFT